MLFTVFVSEWKNGKIFALNLTNNDLATHSAIPETTAKYFSSRDLPSSK